MSILIGLVAGILIVIVLGILASGLGTILGFISLLFVPPGRKRVNTGMSPQRSRTMNEIREHNAGNTDYVDPMYRR